MKADELRANLRSLGLSQRAFAAMLTEHSDGTTVTPTTVNRWCTGEHPIPGAVALAVSLMGRVKAIGDDLIARPRS